MQFTGHSLPVHQSMSVPWDIFSSSHFISQFLPTRFPLITAIRMCHLLPVNHLGMAFLVTFSLCNTCPTNYYLNLFYYLCVVGHLDMCASRYNTDASFILPTQRALHNSLKKCQNLKRTILWSQILITNPVTLVIPAIHFAWIPHDHTPVLRSTGSYLE